MASSSFSRRVPSSLLNPQLQSRAAASIARKRSRSAVGAIAAPPYAAHLPRLLAARYVGIQLGAQNLVQTPARLYSSNASPISSGAADMFHGLARLDQTPARLFSSNASPTSTGAADMFHGLARLDQTPARLNQSETSSESEPAAEFAAGEAKKGLPARMNFGGLSPSPQRLQQRAYSTDVRATYKARAAAQESLLMQLTIGTCPSVAYLTYLMSCLA
jgi:hypothetical protein